MTMAQAKRRADSGGGASLARLAGLPLVWLLSAVIWAYRLLLSPVLPPACRFAPTCSAYALEALQRHGPLRGSWLAARRILRCHPWGGSGYDPVPAATVPRDPPQDFLPPCGHTAHRSR